LLERTEDTLLHPGIAVKQISCNRQSVGMATLLPWIPSRSEWQKFGSQDLQGARILYSRDKNRHIPSDRPAVEQPATGGLDDIEHSLADDVQLVPQAVVVLVDSHVRGLESNCPVMAENPSTS
jgi:hypothetical protein